MGKGRVMSGEVRYRMKDGITYEKFIELNKGNGINRDDRLSTLDYSIMYKSEYLVVDNERMVNNLGSPTAYGYVWDIDVEGYDPLSFLEVIEDEVSHSIDECYIGDHFDGEAKPPVDTYASHYTGDGIEACEIQDMVSDILDGRIPAKDINMLWNIIKYVKRCGKKDNVVKEIVKIANYGHKLSSGKFMSDVGEVEAKLLKDGKV